MPFEYRTICKPDNFWPFEYQTSPVFRWLLYYKYSGGLKTELGNPNNIRKLNVFESPFSSHLAAILFGFRMFGFQMVLV